jgi:hypothetical protein
MGQPLWVVYGTVLVRKEPYGGIPLENGDYFK